MRPSVSSLRVVPEELRTLQNMWVIYTRGSCSLELIELTDWGLE